MKGKNLVPPLLILQMPSNDLIRGISYLDELVHAESVVSPVVGGKGDQDEHNDIACNSEKK